MALIEMKVRELLDSISLESPAPGGGSASALIGSVGAGLGAMVCKLTYTKKRFQNVEDKMKKIDEELESIKVKLLDIVDADAEAFLGLMQAFKLPKETDEEKEARKYAIEHATEKATQVPFKVMQYGMRILELLVDVARDGNPNSISDVGVASGASLTAVKGAMLNVRINLSGIKDENFRTEIDKKSKLYESKSIELAKKIDEIVNKKLEV